MNIPSEFENLTDKLKQQRDEVNVQLHLATMEAKQDWNKEWPMPFSRYGTNSSGGYQVVENDFKQISNYLKTIAEPTVSDKIYNFNSLKF